MTLGQDLVAQGATQAKSISPIGAALSALDEATDEAESIANTLDSQLSIVLSPTEPQTEVDSAKCAGGVSGLEESILCQVRQLRRTNAVTASILHRLQL